MARRSTVIILLAALIAISSVSTLMVNGDSEPNDQYNDAEEITPGVHSGEVDYVSDTQDYFKFQAAGGDIIVVTFESNATDYDLMFSCENSAYEELIYLESMDNNSASGKYYIPNESASDWYYLIVEAYGSGNYTITLALDKQDDAGTGGDVPGAVETAYEITEGEYSGHVEYEEDDYDFYKFWTGEGAQISVEFISFSTEYELTLYLYDASETELFFLDSINEGSTSDSYTAGGEMGWHYIVVEAYGDGNYTFTLSLSGQDDAGQGVDAPSEFNEALTITKGTYNGTVTYQTDQVDMFRFTAGEGDIIGVDFTYLDEGEYLTMKLHDNDRNPERTVTSNGSMARVRFVTSLEDEDDWFYIRIEAYSSGNYTFILNLTDQNDGGSGGDAPSYPTGDLPIISPSTFTGTAGDDDVSDYYNITATAGDIIWLSVNATGTDIKFHLMNSTTELKGSFDVDSGKSTIIRMAVDWSFKGTRWIISVINAEFYEIEFSTTHQDDAGSGTDAPGQPYVDYDMITTLQDGDYEGYIDRNNDMEDYYRIDIEENETIYITVHPESSVDTLQVWIRNRAGSDLDMDTSYNGVYTEVSYSAASGMDLYLVVKSSMGHGNYSFRININEYNSELPGVVGLVNAWWSGFGVRITWIPPEGPGSSTITNFKIYRKVSTASEFTLLNTVSDLYYDDSSGIVGTTYIYGVAAANPAGIGPITESDTVTWQSGMNIHDTDGDGMPNSWEVEHGLNPNDPGDAGENPDGDGRTNLQEYIMDSDPNVFDEDSIGDDSDSDGMPDSWETFYNLDPNDPSDAGSDIDNDGVSALDEYHGGSDPTDINSVPVNPPVVDDDWYDDLPRNWEYLCICGICGALFILVVLALLIVIIIRKRKGASDLEE